jgi:hypothetical protein
MSASHPCQRATMPTVRAFVPALGVSLAFSVAGAGEKIAFHPEAGTTVQKSFATGIDLSLDDFSWWSTGRTWAGRSRSRCR